MKPAHILLVEDSDADVMLVREALEDSNLDTRLHVVKDGVEALDFLRRHGSYANAPRPDLILLDLNLPRKDGREVLNDIKRDPELRVIPTVVLTTSTSEEDVVRAYRLHANCYITKPLDFRSFKAAVRAIEVFWLTVVQPAPS